MPLRGIVLREFLRPLLGKSDFAGIGERLDGEFGAAYRNLEVLYNGRNPYIEAIDRNVDYLRQILRSENWRLLRRNPPIFAASADPMSTMRGLMLGYIKRVWAAKQDSH